MSVLEESRPRCPATGKARFDDEAHAARWLTAHRRSKGPGVPGMRAYRCMWCQGVHLTKGRARRGKP